MLTILELLAEESLFSSLFFVDLIFSEHLDYLFQQELCRQAKIEYAEETRKAQELHDKIKADVAEAKYNKHYDICWEVSTLYQASQLV